jgi:hypothetical protein
MVLEYQFVVTSMPTFGVILLGAVALRQEPAGEGEIGELPQQAMDSRRPMAR